MYKGKN